jgi:hypothetical protein
MANSLCHLSTRKIKQEESTSITSTSNRFSEVQGRKVKCLLRVCDWHTLVAIEVTRSTWSTWHHGSRSPDPPGLTWHHGSTTTMSCATTQQYANQFPLGLNTILVATLPKMGACIRHPHAAQQSMHVTCSRSASSWPIVCEIYRREKSSRKKAHQSQVPLIDSVKSKVGRSSACCEFVIGIPLLPSRSPDPHGRLGTTVPSSRSLDPPGLTWHHSSTATMSCATTQQYAHQFPSGLNTILVATLPKMGACISHPHAAQQSMHVTCTNKAYVETNHLQ